MWRTFASRGLAAVVTLLLAALSVQAAYRWADEEDGNKVMAGLKKFQFLIGNWRASSQIADGQSTGTVENLTWQWHFAIDEPPALKVKVEDGDYLAGALLRYDPEEDEYLLVADRVVEGEKVNGKPKTETVVYEGKSEPSEVDPKVNVLSMTRKIPGSSAQERITLKTREKHHYIFQLDSRRTSKLQFRPVKIFSTTREGETIAKLEEAVQGPICFISGGLGTSTYSYKGKTYYFCCSGCLETFKDDPEKWIADAAKKEQKK